MTDDNSFFVTPEIRSRYLGRRQNDVSTLRDAVAAGNLQMVSKLGHDWKGNGETYGFPQISTWGKNLEDAAKDQKFDVIKSIIEEVAKFLSQQAL